MNTHRHDRGGPALTQVEKREAANRQTESLAAVAIILALLTLGLFLVHTLRHSMNVEDCLMAGRRDCDAVAARTR
jgi:hypothetical protein